MPEAEGSSPNLTGTTVGRFEIRARLGAGGMGEVYLAEDTQLKRQVALKRMALHLGADSRHRQRFLREAQLASRLNNPYIAGIYDVFERENEVFLVMEYVEGKPLRQFLSAPMKPETLLPIAIECARGLAAAHAQGVLHRDIKPENIMITPSGHVKILDFGLARLLDQVDETVSFQTEPGSLAGTAGYMAPEVLQEGQADPRSDIFALGVVFYEALSGRHPFRAKTFLTTSHRVLKFVPPPLDATNRAVPPELDRIIAKMLAKDPAERYPTAAELAAELNLIERATSSGIRLAPGWSRDRVRLPALLRGRSVLWIAALILLAGLAALSPVRDAVEEWFRSSGIGQSRRQVVVLPFAALDGSSADQAFATGLTDTLTARLTELSATHSLEVVPASEVFSNKVTTPELARQQFGVNLVFTGSLQRAGDRVRVTFSLVDTRNRRQLGARTITVAAADPFAVEDDVSSGALEMLKLQLQPSERKGFREHGTDKPDAYAFYLQGMGFLQNYERSENISNAIDEFQQALKIDPNYARAFAGLGQAYWQQYLLTQDAKWTEMSRQACRKAIQLNQDLAAAMSCLGTVANGMGNYQEAAGHFQKALAADPTSDRAYLGLASAYEKLGRTSEAEQTYQKAIQLRPQYWAGYTWMGIFYFRQGRYDDARRMFHQVIALVPDSFVGYYDLGGIYVQQGNFADAIAPLQRSIAIRPTDAAYTNLGTAYFFLHQYDQAVRNFRESVKLLPNSYIGWRNLGDGYYWAPGQRDQAASAYRKAIDLSQAALKVNPHDAYAYEIMAVSQAMAGEKAAALASLKSAQLYAPQDPEISYAAALIDTHLGDLQQAMKWLKQALAGGYSRAIVNNDPALDPLRGIPGFPSAETGSDKTDGRK